MVSSKLWLIFVFIMVMGFASAYDDLGTYKIERDFPLFLGCSYNNSYCPASFNCNISIYFEGNTIISNQQMTATGFDYNYTLRAANLTQSGQYYGRQVCCGTDACSDYAFTFDLNAQGKEYTTTDGIIYVVLLGMMAGLFGVSLFFALRIEKGNIRGGEGEIIQINWMKYLRIGLFMVAYVSLVALFWFAWNLAYGILEFSEMATLFHLLFRITLWGSFPMFVVALIVTVARFFQDNKINEYMERNLTVK